MMCAYCEKKLGLAGFAIVSYRMKYGEISHDLQTKYYCSRDCLSWDMKENPSGLADSLLSEA